MNTNRETRSALRSEFRTWKRPAWLLLILVTISQLTVTQEWMHLFFEIWRKKEVTNTAYFSVGRVLTMGVGIYEKFGVDIGLMNVLRCVGFVSAAACIAGLIIAVISLLTSSKATVPTCFALGGVRTLCAAAETVLLYLSLRPMLTGSFVQSRITEHKIAGIEFDIYPFIAIALAAGAFALAFTVKSRYEDAVDSSVRYVESLDYEESDRYGRFDGESVAKAKMEVSAEPDDAPVPVAENAFGEVFFRARGDAEEFAIPERINGKPVVKICEEAFRGCTGLRSVVIPQTVKTIGKAAFDGCENLAGIELPSALDTIEEWAFGGCTSLEQIVIPESVTTIGDRAFSGSDAVIRAPHDALYYGFVVRKSDKWETVSDVQEEEENV